MSPKVPLVVLLGALAFAPALVVAQHNQPRLRGFRVAPDVAAQARRVARVETLAPPANVLLDPVLVLGVARRAPPAEVVETKPTVCQPWRRLVTSSGAAQPAAPMVRACDGSAVPEGSEAPADARVATRPAPERAREHWSYEVDLAAP